MKLILLLGLVLIGATFVLAASIPVSDDDFLADEESVEEPPLNTTIVSSPLTLYVDVGDTVKLPCDVHNIDYNASAIVWNHGNSTVFLESTNLLKDDNYTLENINTLVLKVADSSYVGNYFCFVSTDRSHVLEHTLILKEPYSVNISENKKVYEIGSNISLACTVKGYPTPTLLWQKDGKSLGTSKVINISNAKTEDSGKYTCLAVAPEGNTAANHTVSIHVVKGVSAVSDIVYAVGGNNVATELCCIFSNKKEVYWLKESEVVKEDDRHKVDQTKTRYCLKIKEIGDTDLGNYTCNSSDRLKAKIILSGVPLPPRMDRVETLDSYPVITWTVESYSPPITNYRIYVKKPEETKWDLYTDEKTETPSKKVVISKTITNLPNGKYDVKLTAMNKNGWSEELISNAAAVLDNPNYSVVKSENSKMSSSGADVTFNLSGLCVVVMMLARLWSCQW